VGSKAEWATADDGTLVQATLSGSPDAFAQLFRRHATGVRRALSDNVHDPECRRDLVQETFTRALTKLHGLDDPQQFRPWVFQIARNAAIDNLRARTRVTTEQLAEDHHPANEDEGPEATAQVRELSDAISNGIATLPPRDAYALSMVVQFGFGPDDVAAALDISYGNAKVVVHRARARLRAAMEHAALPAA
jgi:RNA polymerase sigma-70 factor (ECF subfamily)